jgi:3',5'-cyclic AMP phosphodiesterase CpdA
MPVRRRADKRRDAISPHEAAWLDGNHDCGFVEFKRDEELQALWDTHGDHDAFAWKPGMSFPEPNV